MDSGIKLWREVVACEVSKILGESTATRSYLVQCQISGVHSLLSGESMLFHEQFGGIGSIQKALRVCHVVVLMGRCAMANAVATSAGPLLVLSERHAGFKSDRSVHVRSSQSTAVPSCESRTHKRRQRILSRHLHTISALGSSSGSRLETISSSLSSQLPHQPVEYILEYLHLFEKRRLIHSTLINSGGTT